MYDRGMRRRERSLRRAEQVKARKAECCQMEKGKLGHLYRVLCAYSVFANSCIMWISNEFALSVPRKVNKHF